MCRLQTNVNEGVTRILDNGAVLKNRFILNYFMLVALKSPVKFSKKCFLGVKFEVVLQKQFLSVFANHSKSDFCTVN